VLAERGNFFKKQKLVVGFAIAGRLLYLVLRVSSVPVYERTKEEANTP